MADKPKTLNRIYQGRVTGASVERNGKAESVEDYGNLLFGHHQIFQDAVNYYLVALAAMATEGDDLYGKFRKQVRGVWFDFSYKGQKRAGLVHSFENIFPKHATALNNPDTGFDFAVNLVLDGCNADKKYLHEALTLVAENCAGDVTQPSKTYFPQLCKEDFTGTFEFSAKSYKDKEGENILIDALNSTNPVDEVKKIAEQMTFGWVEIKTSDGLCTGKKAIELLKDAVFYFESPANDIPQKTMEFFKVNPRSLLKGYYDKISQLKTISFSSNRKCKPILRNAFLLAKFFPDDFTISLLKTIFNGKKHDLEGLPKYDAIEESRGSRGYIFKPFTSLSCWSKSWKPLDMEAFMEALKTINQFRDKVTEREEELKKVRAVLDYMEGKTGKAPKDSGDDGEDDAEGGSKAVVLFGDPRWDKLQILLKEDLGICNELTENELYEYGITSRTIRSFSQLKRQWLEIMKDKASLPPEEMSVELIRALNEFQANNKDVMGSADLFRALAKPRYFSIWADKPVDARYSNDVLQDAVKYYDLKDDEEHLNEPISVTPADAHLSRRLCNMRALNYDKKGYQKGYGHLAENTFATDIAYKENGKYSYGKAVIQYSAPRLKRDGLVGRESSVFLPPVLQSLLQEEQSDKQDFKSAAVNLMPDWDRKGKMRILLNFSVGIEITSILKNFSSQFEKQFYFAFNENRCLLWPDYDSKHRATWYQTQENFDIVSVDLGQRFAGALSRIGVSKKKSDHGIWIGNDGKADWYAERKFAKLLRLPGEDAQTIRNGKFVSEFSGDAGRLATHEETNRAYEICRELCNDTKLLETLKKSPNEDCTKINLLRYFPEQNDKLLIALRRGMNQFRCLLRWLWMLKDEDPQKQDRAKQEIKEAEWLQRKDIEYIAEREQKLRKRLPELLIQVADRILPLRGRKWEWVRQGNTWAMQQTEPGTANEHTWICGQRGLSFMRLEQLEELRKRCQMLNRLLMRDAGSAPMSLSEMRKTPIPDCCPDILMRLDAMKEQRVNQTVNMILAQALGVQHKIHESKASVRAESAIHGEYERIPGVEPVAFIVIENLSRYKFSQDRSKHENSRLMKWSHRQIRDKLVEMAELFGIPVVEVDAAYSSKFTAGGIPGFRGAECHYGDLCDYPWTDDKIKDSEEKKLVVDIRKTLQEMMKSNPNATAIMPQDGGPIFIPYGVDDNLIQADINASFNIGLRALANKSTCLLVQNRLSCQREAKSSLWKIKRSGEFMKQVYAGNYDAKHVLSDKDGKWNGGNIFILGCPLEQLTGENVPQPEFVDEKLKGKFPNLMFGASILRKRKLQLKRCLELNQKRLARCK